jgi:hypothetical protein
MKVQKIIAHFLAYEVRFFSNSHLLATPDRALSTSLLVGNHSHELWYHLARSFSSANIGKRAPQMIPELLVYRNNGALSQQLGYMAAPSLKALSSFSRESVELELSYIRAAEAASRHYDTQAGARSL